MSEADGQVVYEVRADDSKIGSDLDNASQKIEKHASKWDSVLTGVGQAIGSNITGMAIDAAKAVWELGTGFENGLAKVSTLVDTASVDMEALGDSLLDLSSKYGIEAEGLAESAYNAISSNNALAQDTAGLMSVLESSTKLAKAGFTDVDTATSATLKTLNAYGLGVEEADRIQKVLIQTQNAGITTVDILGGVLSGVTPKAAAMNMSFEEVGASLATMTAQGVESSEAVTQLNAILTAFLRPTEQMKVGLRGITDEMIANGELTGPLAEEYANLQATAQQYNLQLSNLDITTQEGKESQKEIKQALEDVSSQMDVLTTDMVSQMIQADGLQGVLTSLNDEFGNSQAKMASALSSTEALDGALQLIGENSQRFSQNLAMMSTETDVVGESFDKVAGTNSERLNRAFTTIKNSGIELYQAISPLVSVFLEFASVIISSVASAINKVSGWIGSLADKVSSLWKTITGQKSNSSSRSYAVGADYIPYDNYPAVLHQGEAVLTAAEAKAWRAGINSRDADAVAAGAGAGGIDYDKLARAMSGLRVVMDGKTVGRLVEPSVSTAQARKLESMQRSGFNGRV